MSTVSLDIVQSEWGPWTLSRVSMDIVQTFHLFNGKCPGESMDIVQGDNGFSGHLQTGKGIYYCILNIIT